MLALSCSEVVNKDRFTFLGWFTNKVLSQGHVTLIVEHKLGQKILYFIFEAHPPSPEVLPDVSRDEGAKCIEGSEAVEQLKLLKALLIA